MNRLLFFRLFLTVTIIASLFSGCRKFVQVPPAPGQMVSDIIFSSDETALAAVNGVYTQFQTGNTAFTNGGLSLYGGLLADELSAVTATTTTDAFHLNQLLATNSIVYTNFYAHAYKLLYRANAILEGLSRSASLTPDIKEHLTGEMRFMRGLVYFYLVNLFGDVPLVTTTDYRINAVLPRAAVSTVTQLIESDLLAVEQMLPITYPGNDKLRPNRYTATTLLARFYLYQQNWQAAEAKANMVINSGLYSLVHSSAIHSTFLKNSNETLWEVANANETAPVTEAAVFIPASTAIKPMYLLTSGLLSSFEPGDLRKTNWVSKNTVNGIDYFYPAKYKYRLVATGSQPTEYNIVFRLAELYLVRAEARAKQNLLTGAKDDLNMIRTRAGLANTTATTRPDILLAIEHQNRVEFFTEWGHRWLDLKRTDKADAVLGLLKGVTWQHTDILFPIPANELTLNPFLTQNSGY